MSQGFPTPWTDCRLCGKPAASRWEYSASNVQAGRYAADVVTLTASFIRENAVDPKQEAAVEGEMPYKEVPVCHDCYDVVEGVWNAKYAAGIVDDIPF